MPHEIHLIAAKPESALEFLEINVRIAETLKAFRVWWFLITARILMCRIAHLLRQIWRLRRVHVDSAEREISRERNESAEKM